MKILAIADEECPALWDHYVSGRLDGIDLIISCGDLKPDYLSFLVTMGHAPLIYVHGNHDTCYERFPPEGCDCVDGDIVTINGVRILGLGGCMRYHPGAYQYTEAEMRRRIKRLRFRLWRSGGVDIVAAHSPPKDLGDACDPAHRGFECFMELIEKYHPKYFLHGHVHLNYGIGVKREIEYKGTRIINVGDRSVIEI